MRSQYARHITIVILAATCLLLFGGMAQADIYELRTATQQPVHVMICPGGDGGVVTCDFYLYNVTLGTRIDPSEFRQSATKASWYDQPVDGASYCDDDMPDWGYLPFTYDYVNDLVRVQVGMAGGIIPSSENQSWAGCYVCYPDILYCSAHSNAYGLIVSSPDLTADGIVNLSDTTIWIQLMSSGQYHAEIDYNGDGLLNLADTSIYASHIGHSCQ